MSRKGAAPRLTPITFIVAAIVALNAASAADNSNLHINNDEKVLVSMQQTVAVNVYLENINDKVKSFVIYGNTSDENIATLQTPKVSPNDVQGNQYNGSVNVTGVMIGNAKITITIVVNDVVKETSTVKVAVTRTVRVIDTLFTVSVASLVSILYINFGCAMDWGVCKETLKRPIGVFIGVVCQFLFMPLLSYGLGILLFPKDPEMQLGLFFTGISPSGGASNIWTMLLGGNLNLSITVTTICTLLSFLTIPLWSFTLGKQIFDLSNIKMPYHQIGGISVALIVPLAIGYLIQKKFPRLCRFLVRIMKPCSVILIVFIVTFAIVTNLYLFELFTWEIILAGMGLPWIGFIGGFIIASLFRRPHLDVRALAIEVGIQNTGISIFLLRFALPQPEGDLTTVVPVSCAIMTPLPLIVFYLLKLILDRRKRGLNSSAEKLSNDGERSSTLTR